MPVFGIMKETGRTPPMLRSHSVLSAVESNSIRHVSASHLRRKTSSSPCCRMIQEPNLVIAAYGTQITLRGEKKNDLEIIRNQNRNCLRVTLPSETPRTHPTRTKNMLITPTEYTSRFHRSNQNKNCRQKGNTEHYCFANNRALLARSSQVQEAINPYSNINDANRKDECGISVANGVDFIDIDRQTSATLMKNKTYCERDCGRQSNAPANSEDSNHSRDLDSNNSVEDLKWYRNNINHLPQSSPTTVKTVWNERHRYNQQFCRRRGNMEVDLCRPKSTKAGIRHTTAISMKSDAPYQLISDGKAVQRPSTTCFRQRTYSTPCSRPNTTGEKKSKFRKRTRSAWSSTHARGEPLNDPLYNPSRNFVDPKFLIQQNHRPTKAVHYIQKEQSNASVVPSVRKAVMSHNETVKEFGAGSTTVKTQSTADTSPIPPLCFQAVNSYKTPTLELSVFETESQENDESVVKMPPQSKEFQLALDQCLSDRLSNVMQCFSIDGNSETGQTFNKNKLQQKHKCETLKLLLEQPADGSIVHTLNCNESASQINEITPDEFYSSKIFVPCNDVTEDYKAILLKHEMVKNWLKNIEQNKDDMKNFTDEWERHNI